MSTDTQATTYEGFTAEERAAMKDRAREAKKRSRRAGAPDPAEAEREVLEKIASFPDADRALAEGVHAVVMAAVPELRPRLWYGMPAYAIDGVMVCHFQHAGKFKARYATLGFSDRAKLDDGALWPTSYALTELTPEVAERITALVRQAVR
ncbi:iron chaperone [Puerhibacterium puerhi]|uniref:iron chaperone n=1 Tax=Puerhibacterium puerhi TaxID=2692623 RepID=UPI0013581A09|nr:DUF1801 domain-containing protein [Puerhibacterium puerhi]